MFFIKNLIITTRLLDVFMAETFQVHPVRGTGVSEYEISHLYYRKKNLGEILADFKSGYLIIIITIPYFVSTKIKLILVSERERFFRIFII